MSDVNERPRGLPFGLDAVMRRPPMRSWTLTVSGRTQLTPRMLRVSFAAADLVAETWRPGQDLVLSLPQADGSIARRHYTIRGADKASDRLDIDFVIHGDSPAVRWARSASTGAVIEAQGPRGRTGLASDVANHLFCGDETGIPGILAMIEALPPGARAMALIEIADPGEAQNPPARAGLEVEWLSRNGAVPGPGTLLLGRLEALKPSPAATHAYVIGETSNVRAQRHYLLERGFDKARITAEGYWRPGRIGGHDHV